MTEASPSPEKDQSLYELVGPFRQPAELPPALRTQPELITLTTGEGTEVCPEFQFDESDDEELRLNPEVGKAWISLTARHGESQEDHWGLASLLLEPRPNFDNQSWLDILKDPKGDATNRYKVYNAIREGEFEL